MIEIKEKVEQVVYFPKNSNEALEIYSLELHSELTQNSYTFSVVDSGNSNRYYKFTVDFSDVDDGEYNYSISGRDTGLIRIGEIYQNYSVTSFDDDVEVIQYGLNVRQRYQHKEVNINQDGTYIITPDDGYDALSKVTAYVNIPQTGHTDEELEEAYKSGYTEGWKDGYSSVVPDAVDYTKLPLTFNVLSAGTINWTASDSSVTRTIEYKVNGGEWTSITSNTGETAPIINVVEGDKIQFKGSNAQYATNSVLNYNSFSGSTASFEAEGNIMSLIYGDDFKNNLTISSEYAFAGLFKGCTNLVSAENLVLPATTLAKYCYRMMFYGCSSLTIAPALPATTLADSCYYQMFYGCSSIITAPKLPATTLAIGCYHYMFRNCTSLTTAPELPATTLADYCYLGMFNVCTSLTTAPALPATTLAQSCYKYMFRNCTSLTTAPELPATTLAERCYYGMFNSCSNINYIKCLATNISATDCTNGWVNRVTSTGTFVKNPDMASWTTGTSGIPTGWTVIDE